MGVKLNIKQIADCIFTMLFDRVGNSFIDRTKEKINLIKVLENDRKNIQKYFKTLPNSDLFNLVEQFIMISAFTEVTFYSSEKLTDEEEDKVWEAFCQYLRKESRDYYIDIEYREKIICCINLHNEAINKLILDGKTNLSLKKQKEQHEEIRKEMHNIIRTLNTETKFQKDHADLDYLTEQMESIMQSYRYDVNRLRKMQIFSISGMIIIILLVSMCVPMSIKYIYNSYTMFFMLCFLIFLILFELLIFEFWRHVSKEIIVLEGKINAMREDLWKIHFDLFDNLIKLVYAQKVYTKIGF